MFQLDFLIFKSKRRTLIFFIYFFTILALNFENHHYKIILLKEENIRTYVYEIFETDQNPSSQLR